MTTLPEQLRAEVAQRIVTGRPWPASSLMIEASDEIERLHALTEGDPTSIYAETADLRAWKESAMSVLAEWDRVHDALGRPGPLGRSLALNTLAEVERLVAENARLREALREAAWLAKLARGSSWPGEMAQRVEDAADHVMAAASLSETGGEDEREWHCEAVAVGLVSDAGECSPEQQIHNAPCGWRP